VTAERSFRSEQPGSDLDWPYTRRSSRAAAAVDVFTVPTLTGRVNREIQMFASPRNQFHPVTGSRNA